MLSKIIHVAQLLLSLLTLAIMVGVIITPSQEATAAAQPSREFTTRFYEEADEDLVEDIADPDDQACDDRSPNTVKTIIEELQAATSNIEATILTNTGDVATNEWGFNKSYALRLDFDKPIFDDDNQVDIQVLYPSEVTSASGEDAVIVIMVTDTNNGETYVSHTPITASASDWYLSMIHGSKNPQTASGGEFDHGQDWLRINFYTAATPRHFKTHSDHVVRSGDYGIDCHFYRT